MQRVIEAGVPSGMARPIAALTIAAGMLVLLWRWRSLPRSSSRSSSRNTGPAGRAAVMPPVDSVFLLLLLLAPVVNPWYSLWALGPAIAAYRPLVPVMGCVSVLAYLNGSVLQEAGWQAATGWVAPYSVPWPVALIQVSAVVFAAVWIQRSKSCKK